MKLTSPRFNWNARLQMAADNSPPMRSGELGLAVRHVQQALIDLGHPMPRSTAKHGSPDGIFGSETREKLKDFQRKQKKTRPDFGVDGVVGQQTMGAFDKLLSTPKTLPPITGPGGFANPDANLAQSLINVLSHPRLFEINFSMMGVSISAGSFFAVRQALKDGAISAEFHALPANVRGFYLAQDALHKHTGAVLIVANTFVLPFTRAVNNTHRATVVHEATHAFCDIRKIGQSGTAFTRDQSESVAHVAQATFHRLLAGGAETDPHNPGLGPIFQKADELAQRVLAKDPLPLATIGELHTLVRNNRTAMGHNNTTNFDGV